MNFNYKKLQRSEWNNLFTSEYKNDNSIQIIVFGLIIDDVKFDKLQISFINIKDEWSAYWDDYNNKWKDHSDEISPIGDTIKNFNIKKAGDKITVSIGGNHILGFSRWGFYSERIEVKIPS